MFAEEEYDGWHNETEGDAALLHQLTPALQLKLCHHYQGEPQVET